MDVYAHIVRFFQGGGAFMIPIAIVAALGLAIALERYIYLSIVSLRNRSLWNDLTPLLAQGDFKRAVVDDLQVGRGDRHDAQLWPLAHPVARRRDDIEKAMEESLMEIMPRLEKRTHYLGTFANMATLTRPARHRHRPDQRVRGGRDRRIRRRRPTCSRPASRWR